MVGLKGKSRAYATSKQYRDNVINGIDDETNLHGFSSADNSRVESTVDDVAKDFAGPSYAPDVKGNPNLEKFPCTGKHSFEHANDAASEVTGQTSTGKKDVAKTDAVAQVNKRVY